MEVGNSGDDVGNEEGTENETSNGASNPERNLEGRTNQATAMTDDLRQQLNTALVDGNCHDAAKIQQTILLMLDRVSGGALRHSNQRREFFLRCSDRIEQLAYRARGRNNHELADQYLAAAYAMSYRNSM